MQSTAKNDEHFSGPAAPQPARIYQAGPYLPAPPNSLPSIPGSPMTSPDLRMWPIPLARPRSAPVSPLPLSPEVHHKGTREASSYAELIREKLIKCSESRDREGRRVWVMAGCAWPATDWDYNELLAEVEKYMDDKVEEDYVVVFLASAVVNRPGWFWLYRTYRTLNRKYKKNLKNLYIVHPARWVKMTMDLMDRFRVSPKFFKKLHYIDSITTLADHVDIKGMPVPEAVIAHDLAVSFSPSVASSVHTLLKRTLQYGVDLSILLPQPTTVPPTVLAACFLHIAQYGLTEEGLFRKSASQVDIERCKAQFNDGEKVNLGEFHDGVHVAAGLIKAFLRELPRPCVEESLYPEMGKLHDFDNDQDRISYIQKHLFHLLEPPVLTLFSQLFCFLSIVAANADANLMTSRNLAIVFGPNIVNSPDALKDMDMCTMVSEGKPLTNRVGGVGTFVRVLVENAETVFDSLRRDALQRDQAQMESKAGDFSTIQFNSPVGAHDLGHDILLTAEARDLSAHSDVVGQHTGNVSSQIPHLPAAQRNVFIPREGHSLGMRDLPACHDAVLANPPAPALTALGNTGYRSSDDVNLCLPPYTTLDTQIHRYDSQRDPIRTIASHPPQTVPNASAEALEDARERCLLVPQAENAVPMESNNPRGRSRSPAVMTQTPPHGNEWKTSTGGSPWLQTTKGAAHNELSCQRGLRRRPRHCEEGTKVWPDLPDEPTSFDTSEVWPNNEE